MSTHTLHVFAPALYKHADTPHAEPAPTLRKLLSKAAQHSVPDSFEHSLACAFGWEAKKPLPTAALTYLADAGADSTALQDRCIVRADPVHLMADQQFLRLFDASVMHLPEDDMQQLCNDLNEFYHDAEPPRRAVLRNKKTPEKTADALQFIAPVPSRWYAMLTHHTQFQTHSLAAVRGAPVQDFLPTGEDARWWHTRWNEIQMFLHQHPLNEQRQARGEFTVNSLWFWGEGQLPTNAPASHYAKVFADDALAIGLSRWTQTAQTAVPDHVQAVLSNMSDGDVLCVLPLVQNPLAVWERDWFEPLLTAIREKRLGALCLYPGDGLAYQLQARHLRYFWRRRSIAWLR